MYILYFEVCVSSFALRSCPKKLALLLNLLLVFIFHPGASIIFQNKERSPALFGVPPGSRGPPA